MGLKIALAEHVHIDFRMRFEVSFLPIWFNGDIRATHDG